jgi:uncharacterized membrane protein
MRARHIDLLGATLLGIAVVACDGLSPARIVLGTPFVLAATGYVLIAAAAGSAPVEPVKRLVLTLAMSLTAAILAIIGLAAAGQAITADAVTIVLAAFVLACSAIALARRRRAPELGPRPPRPRLRLRWMWLVSAAVSTAAFAALFIALDHPLPNDHVSGDTELWAVNGGGNDLRIGVRNQQVAAQRYRVEIQIGDRRRALPEVTVQPGRTWTRLVASGSGPARPQVLEVRLYRADDPNVLYRHVTVRA